MASFFSTPVTLPPFCNAIKQLSGTSRRIQIYRDLEIIFEIIHQDRYRDWPQPLQDQVKRFLSWLEKTCPNRIKLETWSGWTEVYSRVMVNKLIVFHLSQVRCSDNTEPLYPDVETLIYTIGDWLLHESVADYECIQLIDQIIDLGSCVVMSIHDAGCDSTFLSLKRVQDAITIRLSVGSVGDNNQIHALLFDFTHKLFELKSLQILAKYKS